MFTLNDKSLIFKIGAVVLLVEILVLSSLGLYYVERFSSEVDNTLRNQVLLPGKLMNRQLLRYQSVSDRKVMVDLVGEQFEDGMVIGPDGLIYYAYDQSLVAQNAFDHPQIGIDLLTKNTDTLVRLEVEDGKGFIYSITPLRAFEGSDPFFYVYIRAGADATRIEKQRIAALFFFGTAFCILLTSLVIISFSRQHVTSPLNDLQESAKSITRGDLDAPISLGRRDEIGRLAESFSAMRDSIREKITELEQANVALEERERRLQALFDALPDRIIIFDWEGVFLEIYTHDNEVSLKSEDLLGKTVFEIHDRELAETGLKAIRTTITTGESQEIEYVMQGPDGDVWFESRTSRIGDESGPNGSVVWVARNITYRKEMEQRLTLAKDEAELANLKLMELDRTKSSLVSSVSHELRTP